MRSRQGEDCFIWSSSEASIDRRVRCRKAGHHSLLAQRIKYDSYLEMLGIFSFFFSYSRIFVLSTEAEAASGLSCRIFSGWKTQCLFVSGHEEVQPPLTCLPIQGSQITSHACCFSVLLEILWNICVMICRAYTQADPSILKSIQRKTWSISQLTCFTFFAFC